MRKPLIALALLLFAGIALAQCELDAKDSISTSAIFTTNNDRTASFEIRFYVPASNECASELGLSEEPKKCDSAAIGNSFHQAIGGLNEVSSCIIQYDKRPISQAVGIIISGKTGVISRDIGNGIFEFDLSDLRMPEPKIIGMHYMQSLVVIIPKGAKIKETIPSNIVSGGAGQGDAWWNYFPKTPVVRYYFPGFIEQNQQAISLALVCFAIGAIVFWFGFAARKDRRNFLQGIESEEKKAERQIAEAGKALEGGKITEETFKRVQAREGKRIEDAEAKKRKAAAKRARTDRKKIEELKIGK